MFYIPVQLVGVFSFYFLQLLCVTAMVFPYFVQFHVPPPGKINCVAVKIASMSVNPTKCLGDDHFYSSE